MNERHQKKKKAHTVGQVRPYTVWEHIKVVNIKEEEKKPKEIFFSRFWIKSSSRWLKQISKKYYLNVYRSLQKHFHRISSCIVPIDTSTLRLTFFFFFLNSTLFFTIFGFVRIFFCLSCMVWAIEFQIFFGNITDKNFNAYWTFTTECTPVLVTTHSPFFFPSL